MTHKDPPAARRVARTGVIEWPRNREHLNVGLARPIEVVDGTPQISLEPARMRGLRFLHESHGHRMWTSLHGGAKLQSRFDSIPGLCWLLKQRLEIFPATYGCDMNPFAVDGKLDFVWGFQATNDI